jgi:hypothetical protein
MQNQNNRKRLNFEHMTHEIDSAFDRFQKYSTNDFQRARRRRSANVYRWKNHVIDVIFLFLDKRNFDSKKNDDFKKHHAFKDEELFNEWNNR